jgi:deoxyadenosine/deoxycytidine kinase
MVDKTDMDQRLKQRDREWRRKYKELDDAWQRNHRELGDKMHAMVCDAIKIGVHDLDTVDKMARMIQTGLARLQVVDSAAETERDPGAR